MDAARDAVPEGSDQHGQKRSREADSEPDVADSECEVASENGVHESSKTKYNPDTEPLPQGGMYGKHFKDAEAKATELVGSLYGFIRNSQYRDDEIAKLQDELKAIEFPQYPADVRVAVIGNSGVGKSSLINSVLGVDKLISTAGKCRAVTMLATEHRKPFAEQKKPFAAEIQLSDLDTCMDAFAAHLQTVYRYFHPEEEEGKNDSEGEEGESEATNPPSRPKQGSKIQMIKSPAATTRPPRTPSWQSSQTDRNSRHLHRRMWISKDMLSELGKWLADTFERYQLQQGVRYFEAHSSSEFVELIKPYTDSLHAKDKYADDDSPVLWPIVRTVKIGLHSQLLEKGIVLVDLPGVSDVNRQRAKATEEHLLVCNYALLVGEIKRILDDVAVHNFLLEAAHRKRHKRKAVILVTTFTDHGINELDESGLKAAQHNQYLLAHQKIVAIRALLSKNQKRRSQAQAKGNLQEYLTLTEQCESLEKVQSPQAKQLVSDIKVHARNDEDIEKLKVLWQQMTQEPDAYLPVFSVSNSMYRAHIEGYTTDNVPEMSVNCTGFPALRHFLYTLPSKAVFDAVDYHCDIKLDGLLRTMAIACTTKRSERQEGPEDIIKRAQKAMEKSVGTLFESIDTAHLHGNGGVLTAIATRESQWTGEARRLMNDGRNWVEDWVNWPWARTLAFCKREGYHQIKGHGPVSWNGMLLKVVRKDLKASFRSLQKACEAWREDTIRT
ncbi:hypothetical protein LTS18_000097 [Coniosporium uncinatum]|uniref:Uncharacterized protein n=1 Tax=Coniosporium uncinatum TaxID=93489 RepID=A0ACC3DZZ0_9PEZI|nr:hypothetical protein LTS18_000097 [Coniosporium uncinatum]